MTTEGVVDATGSDRHLAELGTWLQDVHRHAGGTDSCAAGCGAPLPCLGHRLGEHAIRAATGPWHVRETVRTDLVTSGVLATGTAPYGPSNRAGGDTA